MDLKNKASFLADLIVEFAMRSTDGIGVSERFPSARTSIEKFFATFPGVRIDVSDEAAAKAVGAVFEESAKAVRDAVTGSVPAGVVEMIREEVLSKVEEMVLGEDAKNLKDAAEDPRGKVIESVTDKIISGFSAAVVLASYDLSRAAQNKLESSSAKYHLKTGAKVMEGSTLHEWIGDDARYEIVRREESLLSRALTRNPFAISEEEMEHLVVASKETDRAPSEPS